MENTAIKLMDGKTELYQWDSNQKVVCPAAVTVVHFTNNFEDPALVVECKDGLAEIPNILLQSPFNIVAYAFNGEATVSTLTIKVNPRIKPSDYIYTETEIIRYSDFIKRLNAMDTNISNMQSNVDTMQDTVNDISVRSEGIENVYINASKEGITSTITIRNRNGEYKTVEVKDGNGIKEIIYIMTTPRGSKYRIFFDNGKTFDYVVYDGKDGVSGIGIKSLEKTRTEGLTDIYTMTFTDNTSYEYSVVNGSTPANNPYDFVDKFTTKEGEALIFKKTHPDGTPYRLKEVHIGIDTTKANGKFTSALSVYTGNAAGEIPEFTDFFIPLHGSKYSEACLSLDIFNRHHIWDFKGGQGEEYVTDTYIGGSTFNDEYLQTDLIGRYITQLEFGNFPTGTNITIQGVIEK